MQFCNSACLSTYFVSMVIVSSPIKTHVPMKHFTFLFLFHKEKWIYEKFYRLKVRSMNNCLKSEASGSKSIFSMSKKRNFWIFHFCTSFTSKLHYLSKISVFQYLLKVINNHFRQLFYILNEFWQFSAHTEQSNLKMHCVRKRLIRKKGTESDICYKNLQVFNLFIMFRDNFTKYVLSK